MEMVEVDDMILDELRAFKQVAQQTRIVGNGDA
jgi:hypothetical protein